MPRPKLLDRPRQLNVSIPATVYSKLQAELHSDVEGRVPHGLVSTVVEDLIRGWLRERGVVL